MAGFKAWTVSLIVSLIYSQVSSQNICTDVGGIGTQFVSNPTSCSAWIACNNRKVVNIGNCDPGYNFDATIGGCRSATSSDCTLGPLLNVCRGKSDGAFVANPQNCQGYFYCKNAVGFPGLCGTSYIFNGTSNQCVEYPNYICPNGAGNSLGNPSGGSNTPCDYFSDGTFLGSMNSCSGYNVCVNGASVAGNCGNSLYFNAASGVCDKEQNVQCSLVGEPSGGLSVPPMNASEICRTGATQQSEIFVSDPGSCTGYYYCPNGVSSLTAVHGVCPGDLWFDYQSKTCASSEKAFCNIQPCYGKSVGYFDRSRNSCSSYYYCGEYGPVLSTCPSGTYFDEKNQNCNSIWSVQCVLNPTTTEAPTVPPAPQSTEPESTTTSDWWTPTSTLTDADTNGTFPQ